MKQQGQPLQLAICPHCGVRSFLEIPVGSPRAMRVKTHKQMPEAVENREVMRVECRGCKQTQFIEVFYES